MTIANDTVQILATEPVRPVWTDRLRPGSSYYWLRLERHLRSSPSWKAYQIDSLAAESMRVLKHLPDPDQSNDFQGRGLVVGYVQSGKTANYTAVAARAVDAGYRLIIVLSGIHDSLRNQTQLRLERELTGNQDGGVGLPDPDRQWVSLTTPTDDFGQSAPTALRPGAPALIVAKKIVPILKRLDAWVAKSQLLLSKTPVLLIDDEADQASINTKNIPDPAVSDADDPNDKNSDPTPTNRLIRNILRQLPKAAYIGYTATPFANILIPPNLVHHKVGEDLFPRDFVLQLPRPEGYTGTEELFGVSAQGREVVREVAPEEVKQLKGNRRRKTQEITINETGLPQSLREAILSFILAGSIRHLRGLGSKPHTMLVHVSQRKIDQQRVAEAINRYIRWLKDRERFGEGITGDLSNLWSTAGENIRASTCADIVATAKSSILPCVETLVLNSDTGEDLNYDARPERHLIAVGGNRLSRGLTLEGLTVSYFLRTTAFCDTLLQMARWYGFRTGYEDLIRIYTTDGIARWFAELALVEQSLRDAIIALNRAQKRPDEMAIRLRAHSELLLTSRAKARWSETIVQSWSGQHPQTVLLPLHEPRKLHANRALTDQFLSSLAFGTHSDGGYLARDVSASAIVEYLRNYQTHDEIVAFDTQRLANWILSRTSQGELADWSVFLASTAAGPAVTLGGKQVGLATRSRISSASIGILTDPRHEGVDLPDGPAAYRRAGGSYDSDAMRAARPPSQGLLICYPLDPSELAVPNEVDTVVALALSLPITSDAAQTWVVNRSMLEESDV